MADFAPVKLVEISDAQDFLHPIAKALSGTSGKSVFLVDDGENQTSDLFIDDAESEFNESGDFENSLLFKLSNRLAAKGNAILIWWANLPLAHQSAQKCTSIENLFEIAGKQVKSNETIKVYLPSAQT